MRLNMIALTFLVFLLTSLKSNAQDAFKELNVEADYDKHGVVWSAGLFKSWLTDHTVDFHQIESNITPVFEEQKKQGFALHSHYMFKPHRMWGVGIHLGLGLDVYSYIQAPPVLFGGSISYGKNHDFIINFGWADGKRKKITGSLRKELLNSTFSSIPIVHQETELNTSFYLGINYRIF